MKDRQPLHAGRVHLEPVNGQQNTFDMTMADGATEQGTPLNKATFLKDATAALYGLTNAVPDDVFAWLGRFNEHYWMRRAVSTFEEKTDITALTAVTTTEGARSIQYSNSISIDPYTGELTLVNPSTVGIVRSGEGAQTLAELSPCYITNLAFNANKVLYLPEGSTSGNINSSTIGYSSSAVQLGYNTAIPVKAQNVKSRVEKGVVECVFSTNRNAYPDSGIVDGYEYEYLGVPFEKLPTAPQIETGSYVGTGTYGASNPNSLTFSFKPKMLMIACYNYVPTIDGTTNDQKGITILMDMVSGEYGLIQNYGSQLYCKYQENVLSYYAGQKYASVQLNTSGTIYYYLAIG